jgi:hypothetical protein
VGPAHRAGEARSVAGVGRGAGGGGRRGPGTTSFCVDGRTTIYEEILDWRPFDYFTETRSLPGGKVVLTTELESRPEGTLMRVRGKAAEKPSPLGGLVHGRRRMQLLERSYDRLAALVAEEG